MCTVPSRPAASTTLQNKPPPTSLLQALESHLVHPGCTVPALLVRAADGPMHVHSQPVAPPYVHHLLPPASVRVGPIKPSAVAHHLHGWADKEQREAGGCCAV